MHLHALWGSIIASVGLPVERESTESGGPDGFLKELERDLARQKSEARKSQEAVLAQIGVLPSSAVADLHLTFCNDKG